MNNPIRLYGGIHALVCSCLVVFGGLRTEAAESVAAFYRGQTVSLNIGTAAGGGYDLYARMLARHLRNHIPGRPNIVPKNIVGAMQSLNYMYNLAPKNGLEISMDQMTVVTRAFFGEPNARFEPTNFTWLGNMNEDSTSCGAWHTSTAKSLDDLLSKPEVTIGGTSANSAPTQHAAVLQNMFGMKAKIVVGYKGFPEIILAMQRGEVDAVCSLWVSSLKTQWKSDWQSGRLKLLVQMGAEDHPAFAGVPNLFTLAKTKEDRQVLQLIFGQITIGRPLFAPPEIPQDRRDALRKAIFDTMRDPAFLTDAKKADLEINAAPAESIERFLHEFKTTPNVLLRQAEKAIMLRSALK